MISKFGSGDRGTKESAADMGLRIDDIIVDNCVVDWVDNTDIQNMMLNKIEEYLYEVKDKYGIDLSFDDIDEIMDQSLTVAKTRYARYQ